MSVDTFPVLTTPVLLLIHARPDTTKLVLESIRAIRPSPLYVAADGPRQRSAARLRSAERHAASRPQSTGTAACTRCLEVRTWVWKQPSARRSTGSLSKWKRASFSKTTAVQARPSTPSCQELLNRYRTEPQVMHIGGDNFQYGRKRGKASYYFSKYALTWGWATWRRAWARHRADAGLVVARPALGMRSGNRVLDLHDGAGDRAEFEPCDQCRFWIGCVSHPHARTVFLSPGD